MTPSCPSRHSSDLLDPVPPLLAPLLAHGQVFVSGATDTMFAAASGAFETICGDLSEAEARRGEAFIASALGRRRIYRNECAGVYYPFLDRKSTRLNSSH